MSPFTRLQGAIDKATSAEPDADPQAQWAHVDVEALAWAMRRAAAFVRVFPDQDRALELFRLPNGPTKAEIAAAQLGVPSEAVEGWISTYATTASIDSIHRRAAAFDRLAAHANLAPGFGGAQEIEFIEGALRNRIDGLGAHLRGVQDAADFIESRGRAYPNGVFENTAGQALRWAAEAWAAQLREHEGIGQPPPPAHAPASCANLGETEAASAGPAERTTKLADLEELLRALAGGAEISAADMQSLAREPLGVVAAVAAQARVEPTTAAAFWLIAQIEVVGGLDLDDSWTWRPARELDRPVTLRIGLDDDEDID